MCMGLCSRRSEPIPDTGSLPLSVMILKLANVLVGPKLVNSVIAGQDYRLLGPEAASARNMLS